MKHRSYQLELLDDPQVPFDDIKINLHELNFINTWLGGHQITIDGLKCLLKNNSTIIEELIICEIGCGGGDNLRAISHWLKSRKIPHQLIGIDLKTECIAYASEQNNFDADWIVSDYQRVIFKTKPHIIFSSLFCHHFTDEQLATQLRWMQHNSLLGFFINDLHRHWLAYFSIKWLTQLFSKSYLVKNDAPLSVKRGFIKKDWQKLLDQTGIKKAQIKWKWAFRWLVFSGR